MAKSGNSIKVILRSTESRHFYTTTRSKRAAKIGTSKGGRGIKKFDPTINKHVVYVEEKMK